LRLIPRLQLFEFHDLEWLPESWRQALTDIEGFFSIFARPYETVVDKLLDALRRAGATEVLDLCSGGGVTSWTVLRHLPEVDGAPLRVRLTDKYPQVGPWHRVEEDSGGRIGFVEQPVDAANVPAALTGFRTIYTAFHHFDREQALAVLGDAVAQRRGIAVFEYTERDALRWGPAVVLMPLFLWISSPWIKPFRWSRMLWTYVVPVIPCLAAWDGLVSCLRSYEPDELLALTEELGQCGYTWESGRVQIRGPLRVTYLIGIPDDAPAA